MHTVGRGDQDAHFHVQRPHGRRHVRVHLRAEQHLHQRLVRRHCQAVGLPAGQRHQLRQNIQRPRVGHQQRRFLPRRQRNRHRSATTAAADCSTSAPTLRSTSTPTTRSCAASPQSPSARPARYCSPATTTTTATRGTCSSAHSSTSSSAMTTACRAWACRTMERRCARAAGTRCSRYGHNGRVLCRVRGCRWCVFEWQGGRVGGDTGRVCCFDCWWCVLSFAVFVLFLPNECNYCCRWSECATVR